MLRRTPCNLNFMARCRDRLRAQFLLAIAALWAGWLAVACNSPPPLCVTGACPAGLSCDTATGECRPSAQTAPRAVPLLGAISAPPGASGAPVVVGFAPDRQSLVAVNGQELSYLAGPAAQGDEQPAGQQSAAARSLDGRLCVAWIRPSDHTLWFAEQKSKGWQREQVATAASGPVALTRHQETLTIAYRRADMASLKVALREAPGTWSVQDVPMPTPPANSQKVTADLGKSIAIVSGPSGLALSAYDATYGDLVLAVRAGNSWSVSRIAGADPATGAEIGDVGDPSALAVGPDGGLVLAYRDNTAGQLVLSRSAGGKMTRQVVTDGSVAGPAGTKTQDLVGTAISLAVRDDGRAVIAWFNGTKWRVEYAIQKQSGAFDLSTLPAPASARPQAWPSLSLNLDGSVWLSWVALDPLRGPAASQVSQLKILSGEP